MRTRLNMTQLCGEYLGVTVTQEASNIECHVEINPIPDNDIQTTIFVLGQMIVELGDAMTTLKEVEQNGY